jgi:hypothetical protein
MLVDGAVGEKAADLPFAQVAPEKESAAGFCIGGKGVDIQRVAVHRLEKAVWNMQRIEPGNHIRTPVSRLLQVNNENGGEGIGCHECEYRVIATSMQ